MFKKLFEAKEEEQFAKCHSAELLCEMWGATTFSITTLSITTHSTMDLLATLSID